LTGCVALGLTLPASLCQASGPQAGLWNTAAALAGQFGGGTDSRRQADDLLRQARKAIKEGNLAQADGLIGQAEKLGVKYDPLTARFVDTPEKLRKLLDEAKTRTPASQLPSSRFPALLAMPGAKPQQAVPADPLTAARGPRTAEQLAGDPKSKATSYLKDARAALAAGDKLAALTAWQKAAALPAQYGPEEDSPQKLAFDLQRAGVDPSRLQPASASPTSPYQLSPSQVAQDTNLPSLSTSPYAAPALIAGQPASPYELPAESNPLAAGPKRVSVYGPQPQESIYSTSGPSYEEPRRLPTGDPAQKDEAARLIAQARAALDRGDVKAAQVMAQQAQDLNVPDNAFAADETRPWQVLLEVEKVARRREGVMQASGGIIPQEPRYPVAQGVYDPAADNTRTIQASSSQAQSRQSPTPAGNAGPGGRLYDEGVQALSQQDRETALAKFEQAWRFQEQLDPVLRQQLKDKLTFLRTAAVQPPVVGESPSPLEQVDSQQEILRQKLQREIFNEQTAAQELAQRDPRGALANVQKLRDRVNSADVAPAAKKQLLTQVDRMVNSLATYIEQNKATIENEEQNNKVRADVVRSQELTIETQNKLAEMVEKFNQLMDEQRFPEAEVIARQARDLDPQNPIVVTLFEKSRLAMSIAEQNSIKERKERAFYSTMTDVEEAGIGNVGDENPLVFNPKIWRDLTNSRRKMMGEGRRLTPAETQIQQSLSKLIEAKFDERPLAEVMDTISKMAGVNIHIDPQGLLAEGLTTDVPVTLNLAQPISLKSALNLLLKPKGLSYVIQNEVLLITSEQTRDKNTYTQVYYAADLVMPIPNFVPGYNIGLPAALRESINALGYGMPLSPSMAGPMTIAKDEAQRIQSGAVPTSVLAQMGAAGMSTPQGVRIPNLGTPTPGMAAGPGGLGGGVVADFGPLIDLIQTTIAPESWVDVGGPGAIKEFESNLSLVVSQTQDVHEQIADLLQQLRRLQDLQVTIEVRFITLSDRFFERIGADFDFRIDDNTHLTNQIDQLPANDASGIVAPTLGSFFDDDNYSVGIGWGATGPTADLDIAFDQGSFGTTTPTFGNFDPGSAANFGFAILSDIEAFFLLQAAQGDDRTNILQAPKVTLFNGQSANVNDQVTRPFVTSVIPVVGDFAAAYQPVVVVLNEGTALNVQAVVSADRRFVRLTLVPFFSQIGDVDTFTFDGSVTTDSGTVVQDPSNPEENVTNGQTRTVQGTTVQLPTFAFTQVSTTVSVPDGGTVLLGGVKRLREGRTERGVPLLSKFPYVSRLFKNVGIGRDAQSLMMMVTPRIIIQEEEEEKLGIELEQ
jgi:general secretion pathway protein D